MFRKLIHVGVREFMRHRMRHIHRVRTRGLEAQEKVFKYLLRKAKNTEYGKEHSFSDIRNYEQYKKRVPTTTYEDFFPYIDRLMKGERHLTWPTPPLAFSRTSGTTNDHSKYVPFTKEAFANCHARGAKDLLASYLDNHPESRLMQGFNLILPGSAGTQDSTHKALVGDLSALMCLHMPLWMAITVRPKRNIIFNTVWDEKLKHILTTTLGKNVTSLSGVPVWVITVMKAAMSARGGVGDLREVWPRLEVFFHGGAPFSSHENICRRLIPHDDMNYVECYMASEGYIAFQDQRDEKDLLLCTDHGMFFEFADTEDEHRICALADIELGKHYAVLLSSNAGLWRYKIGDIVRFVSKSPYRIRVVGRTKQYINSFGEHLIGEVASEALKKTCQEMPGVLVNEFTAAPKPIKENEKGRHEWVIEFIHPPKDIQGFQDKLDNHVRRMNSYYDFRRRNDFAMNPLVVHSVPQGTFYKWMQQRGKLGGQHKVPILSNQRHHLEALLRLAKENTYSN